MAFNSTFGDFTETVYDLFINPILVFIYLILSLLLYFKTSINKQYYYLLLIPIIFIFISLIWKTNQHKDVALEGIITNSKGSTIKLFTNESFEIKLQHQHGADFKKGNYHKNGNKIVLKQKNIEELTDRLFTQNYIIIENENLKPIGNKNFESITIFNKNHN